MDYKKFNSEEPTLNVEFVTPEQRQFLIELAGQAHNLNRTELNRLVGAVQDLGMYEKALADEAAEKAALEEHYRQEAKREIAAAARVAENERRVRIARVDPIRLQSQH